MPTSPTDATPERAETAPTTALAKHACAACGAQAEWNPTRKALVCPFCGTEAPAELDDATGAIVEHDLVRMLREVPDDRRGWAADKRSVQCQSCRAVSVFDPARVGQNCEFCGSPQLVDYQEIKAPIRPESLLPFHVPEGDTRDKMRAWCRGRWFAPGALKRKAWVDTVHGVYLPYWTFDAQAFCKWTAEAGFYYYTSETVRDSSGRTRTRRVRHTRWRPTGGSIEHFFDDVPVAGTSGVDRSLLRAIEPFPNEHLVPYDTAYVSGFVVEHYQVVLLDAAREARGRMEAELRQLCARQIQGDTYRNLVIDPDFSAQTFKHLLVPVWLLTYVYRGKPYQLLANGYTGTLAGRYPKSFWKIALAVLAAAAAIATVVLLEGSGLDFIR